MTDITDINPNETLLRVRQLVVGRDAEFTVELDRAEIEDMLFCAAGLIAAIRTLAPNLIDASFAVGADPADFEP